ncbi:MAG: thioredoxin family protein [Erysipelothrix sp.]|nr:thioredoxin family protein [Erysipelothrix sp.]
MKTQLYPTGKHLVEVPCNTCDATYTLSEVASRVAQKFENIQFHQLKMDDKLPEIAEAWGITQVPALVLINEGEIVGKVHGYQPDEILELYIQAKMKEEKN